MVLPRIFNLITIALFIATLVISVTSEPIRYIVVLNSLSSIASSDKSHYEWLSEELTKISINSLSSYDAKVKMFSIEGDFRGYTAWFPENFMKKVESRAEVKYVEKDSPVSIKYAIPRAVQNSPNPNLDRIDQAKLPLDEKFTFPDTAGENVNVYVLDTGINVEHTEFENRARFGGTFCDGCPDIDDNGHGSHVAGIVAGKTFGVAKKANLIGVKVLDAGGSGSNADVILGMQFILEDSKKQNNSNTVVNMSLGGTLSQAVNAAAKSLTDAGIHVVVAAGNEAADACLSSPASENSVITVGATDTDDTLANFSNFGRCVDIFAPGTDILSVGIRSNTDVAVFSGTSQAAPHVAGTLALLISKNGNKNPADLTTDLIELSSKNEVKGLDRGTVNNFLRVPAP